MTRGSFMISTSTDRDHDLQPVAVGNKRVCVRAPGHDFAVAFHGDLLAPELQLLQDGRYIERAIEAMRRSVHGYVNHGRMILKPIDDLPGAQFPGTNS